jgi:hypothetical protein
MMTFARKNLSGITTNELLEKINKGKPFFIRTRSANVTRVLLAGLKKKYQLEVTTRQDKGGMLDAWLGFILRAGLSLRPCPLFQRIGLYRLPWHGRA